MVIQPHMSTPNGFTPFRLADLNWSYTTSTERFNAVIPNSIDTSGSETGTYFYSVISERYKTYREVLTDGSREDLTLCGYKGSSGSRIYLRDLSYTTVSALLAAHGDEIIWIRNKLT